MTGFSILYNMRITKTSKEIADIINETIGMDICCVDVEDDVKIDAMNDVEGNEICFHDYIFCCDAFYHYVNQQGMAEDGFRPYFTLSSCIINDDAENNYKCFNRDGEYDDYCDYSVTAGDVGEWTFDEETFNNTLEALKIVFKVKNDQQAVIFDDDVFVV